jgi:hypothetical protein
MPRHSGLRRTTEMVPRRFFAHYSLVVHPSRTGQIDQL